MLRPSAPQTVAGRPQVAAAPRAVPVVIAGCIALVGCLAMVACGVPPELRDPGSATPTRRTPTPTAASGSPSASSSPTPSATPTASSDAVAVACTRGPTKEQVLALLRRSGGLVPSGARPTYPVGPLCAGQWQYTVVQFPGNEPLHVVSRGPADALRLVTAGTAVCTIPVRTEAPAGIRVAACESGSPGTGGL